MALAHDPYLGFNFLVEIDGLVVGGFSEVSGLLAEVEVHDYREGGLNTYIHRRPGPARYPSSIVLKRGITDADEFWKWHRDVRHGIVERRNVAIMLRNPAGDIVRVWTLEKAFPVRWSGPELRASSNTVAVETLELAHCGFAAV